MAVMKDTLTMLGEAKISVAQSALLANLRYPVFFLFWLIKNVYIYIYITIYMCVFTYTYSVYICISYIYIYIRSM